MIDVCSRPSNTASCVRSSALSAARRAGVPRHFRGGSQPLRHRQLRDLLLALDAGAIETQTKIKLRWRGDLIDLITEHSPQDVMRATVRENVDRLIDTTAGRVILNERLTRHGLPFVNGTLKKKGLPSLVSFSYLKLGHAPTVTLLDDLKSMGFLYATLS